MGKQVKTPRFYVDMPTFLHATGQLSWDYFGGGVELLYMNCANPYLRGDIDNNSAQVLFAVGHNSMNPIKTKFPINFCALLNHNLASDVDHPFSVVGKKGLDGQDNNNWRLSGHNNAVENVESVLNCNPSVYVGDNSSGVNPMQNGTSIFTFSDADGLNEYWRSFEVYYGYLHSGGDYFDNYQHQLGSLVVGKYFDCPNSPDLNLTMSRRFDGIKKQKTIGGKTLANVYYDGPTEWTMNHKQTNAYPSQVYKYTPFELDNKYGSNDFTNTDTFDSRAKSGIGRKGLRSWNLTFSYIAESDMWIDNEVSNNFTDTSGTYDSPNSNAILLDKSFNFVWNCTLGGTLPFIFQPDNTNGNPDQFAICTFRENSFKVNQVAFNTYSVSMTIDELA